MQAFSKNIFQKKRVLIIGSTGGMGQILVKKLKERQATVINSSRSNGRYSLDLNKTKQIIFLANKVKREYGKIDFIFNASGLGYFKRLKKTTEKEIRQVIEINLIAPIILTQRFVSLVNERGAIIHFGSMAGISKGHRFFSIYSAAKEGLAGFLRSASAEFPNINFILVTPAGVKTNIAEKAIGGKELAKKFNASNLELPGDVINGLLNSISFNNRDVRLFPTERSKKIYEKISK